MFVLHLFSDNTNEWLEFNALGALVSRQSFTDFLGPPNIHPADRLTILFPGEQLLLSKVKLPAMGFAEKLKAIPYALEDQLAGDPDQMIVAIGDAKSDGENIVAVVDKNLFEEKLKTWNDNHLFPQAALPDFLAITWEPDTWSIVINHKMALVRTNIDDGFSVDINNLILSLQLSIEKNKDHLPKRIMCWQNKTIISPVECEKINIPVEWMDESKHAFDLISISVRPVINLLQGKYQATLPFSQLRKKWWWRGMIASVFVFLLFATQFIKGIYFSYQSKQLENKIAVVYRQLFPGSTAVLEPHFRVDDLLKKYAAASEGGVFLKLIGSAGKIILQFPTITVQSILYDNKILHVTIQTDKTDTINGLLKMLRSQDFIVDQRTTKSAVNSITAEIIIQEKQ